MTRQDPAQVVCFHSGLVSAESRSPNRRGGLVHSTRKTQLRIVAIGAAMTMLVAACGGSSKKSNSSSGGNAGTVNTTPVPQGGTLTVGAEQEPDCLDFLSSCAGASWGSWTVQI